MNVLYLIGKPIEGYLNFESDPNYIDANGGECLDLILDGKFQWRKSQCSSINVSHAFIAEKGKGTIKVVYLMTFFFLPYFTMFICCRSVTNRLCDTVLKVLGENEIHYSFKCVIFIHF